MIYKKRKVKTFSYRGYKGTIQVILHYKIGDNISLNQHQVFISIGDLSKYKLCTDENLLEEIEKSEQFMQNYIDSVEANVDPLEESLKYLGFK